LTGRVACGELVANAQDQRRMAKARNRMEGRDEGMVSLLAEVPEPLLQAMRRFIDEHPNWDQYRLFQAALAGFLVQHAPGDRTITRCYLANLFPGSARFQSPPPVAERPRLRGLPRVTPPAAPRRLADSTGQAA
jgi:hypothetical protein